MDTLSSQVASLAAQNIFLAYVIIYLATIFFGNIGAFVALWVAFQGGLGEWGVPLVLVAGVCANLTGDTLWYTLGRTLRATRLGNWLKHRTSLYRKYGERLEAYVQEKGPRWMLFGKFVYGSNFPVIFSLGWTKFPFGRFFRRSLLAIAIWAPVILGIAYGLYSGLAPLTTAIGSLKNLEITLLGALILFIIIQFLLAKALSAYFGRNGKEKE